MVYLPTLVISHIYVGLPDGSQRVASGVVKATAGYTKYIKICPNIYIFFIYSSHNIYIYTLLFIYIYMQYIASGIYTIACNTYMMIILQ